LSRIRGVPSTARGGGVTSEAGDSAMGGADSAAGPETGADADSASRRGFSRILGASAGSGEGDSGADWSAPPPSESDDGIAGVEPGAEPSGSAGRRRGLRRNACGGFCSSLIPGIKGTFPPSAKPKSSVGITSTHFAGAVVTTRGQTGSGANAQNSRKKFSAVTSPDSTVLGGATPRG